LGIVIAISRSETPEVAGAENGEAPGAGETDEAKFLETVQRPAYSLDRYPEVIGNVGAGHADYTRLAASVLCFVGKFQQEICDALIRPQTSKSELCAVTCCHFRCHGLKNSVPDRGVLFGASIQYPDRERDDPTCGNSFGRIAI
jgi:hypothetical protein